MSGVGGLISPRFPLDGGGSKAYMDVGDIWVNKPTEDVLCTNLEDMEKLGVIWSDNGGLKDEIQEFNLNDDDSNVTKDALKQSEQRFRALFEQSSDAVFLTDLNLRLLDVNKRASQLLGYEVEELIGVHVQQFIAPEEWGEAIEKLPLILSGESLSAYECTFVRKDGSKVPVELSVSLVCDANRKPLYIQSIARDISERKKAEKAIKEERALLRTLIDNIPAFIYAKDEDCRFILNNRAHIQSMGAKNQEEVRGKTDLDVFPNELAKQYYVADQAVVTLGFPILDKEELFVNRNTGESIWMSATKAPIKDEMGKVIGLVGVSTDITDRKRVEVALRESEEKFRLLSEQSLLGIVIIQDNVVKYCNQAACDLIEYCEEEIMSWIPGELTKLFHPEDAVFVNDQLQKKQNGLEKDIVPHYTYRIITKSGKTIWVEQYSKTIQYEERPAELATIVDITERKIADQRLQHLATHDPLTNLPNRILFFDRLNHAMALAKRNDNHVALLFIDLDGFKNVNDEHGHENGDFVLRELASRLKEGARASDTIARLSGDEFIYILENVSDDVRPAKVAERLLASINKPFSINGGEIYLTASIGVSIFPEDGDDPHDLLRNADIAMYRNKITGKNGYTLYS
jgi:diguanylate cyclase (GGDEF)-like protein/PAS domain S-box-containing protein